MSEAEAVSARDVDLVVPSDTVDGGGPILDMGAADTTTTTDTERAASAPVPHLEDSAKPATAERFPSGGWQKARSVVNHVQVSKQFKTLRTMHDDIFIDASKLTYVSKLGEGAFGTVDKYAYSADGKQTFVAVKQIKRELMESEEFKGVWNDFQAEMELMSKLSHHYLVDYLGMSEVVVPGDTLPVTCILQEFCYGGTLKTLVLSQSVSVSSKLYSNHEAWKWMRQLARALHYLHSARPSVIHRDLKLENLLLTRKRGPDRDLRLADFGLSTLLQASKKSENRFALTGGTGSLMYMAPEVYKGEPYDHKVDVFSFAVVAYEVISRRTVQAVISVAGTPSEIESYVESVSNGHRQDMSATLIPEAAQKLINQCWAQEPSERPEMGDVAAALTNMEQDFLDMDAGSGGCGCSVM